METIKMPKTSEWVNKIWYIHAMEYYLPTKWTKYQLMLQYGWTLQT